jgi:hypothetical protein
MYVDYLAEPQEKMESKKLGGTGRIFSFSSEYKLFFKGLMEPTCLNIIFIRVCVCNPCGFHAFVINFFLE